MSIRNEKESEEKNILVQMNQVITISKNINYLLKRCL